MTKSRALRLAKTEAIARGEPPFVWAAFVLLGD
jgi:CHAT domain-containing protein